MYHHYIKSALLAVGITCVSLACQAGGSDLPEPELDQITPDQTAPDQITTSTGHWAVSIGTGYAFVKHMDTSGDLASTDEAAGTHDYVKDGNLDFQSAWTGEGELTGYLSHYFGMGFAYMHLKTNTSPGDQIVGEGGDANTWESYRSGISINTFLFKAYLNWWHMFNVGKTPISMFIGGGMGASNLALSNQEVVVENATITNTLANHSVWQLSYSGEVGLNMMLNNNWDVNLGGRYTYYGEMDSGTFLPNYQPGTQLAPVKTKLYAIQPFINLAWNF